MQEIAQSLNDILIADLPTKIRVNDKIYDINYDYRSIIKIITAFEDPNLYDVEKVKIMVNLLYRDNIPNENLEEACKKASLFIDLGQKITKRTTKRIYSFSKDANYIFSGINQTHHIDLSLNPNLHWWKFMALFMDMGTDCFFSNLVYFRKRRNEGKLTKEEKKEYKKIKDLIELDEIPTEELIRRTEAKNKFLQELEK